MKFILVFITYAANFFTKEFTLLMQKDEPLIHILYSQLRKIVMIVMSSIVKGKSDEFKLTQNVFDDNKIEEILNDFTKTLPLTEIDGGENLKSLQHELKKSDRQMLMSEIKKFYVAAILHINKKIGNKIFLRKLGCLSPENIKNSDSAQNIIDIAKELPFKNIDYNVMNIEWKLLQMDEDVQFNLKKIGQKYERIDTYWVRIFNLQTPSGPRYPLIAQVVKAALSLPHGNGEVERGFSESSLQMTDDKSNMGERMLNAKLTISDAIKKYENLIYKIPVTKDMIKFGRSAYRSYQNYLDERKRKEEMERAQELLSAAEKEKEKKALENLAKEVKNVNILQEELKEAKEKLKHARKNANELVNLLHNSSKNGKLGEVNLQMMTTNIKRLKRKEEDEAIKVDELQDKIQEKLYNAVKRQLKEKKIN